MSALAAAALVIVVAAWWRPRLATPRGRVGRSRRPRSIRRRPPPADAWAALLDGMATEVRTGSSLTAAFRAALGRHPLDGAVVQPGAELHDLTTAPPTDPDEAVVAQAIGAAHALGGQVAATLDAASALLRERAAIRAEAQAHSAQARLSARVLTCVPIGFAGWSALASRSFRTALVSPLGVASATAGALANLLGWWWMRRLVTKAVR